MNKIFFAGILSAILAQSLAIAQTQPDHVINRLEKADTLNVIPVSPLIRKKFQTSLDISPSLPNVTYRFYEAKSYYTRGMFRAMPFNEWGPYQVPFHLANQKIVVIKPKR